MPDPVIPPELESTAILIDRARTGEQAARDLLARRYLSHLRIFARGRLPGGVRSLEETDDIVQVAMIRGFARLDSFHHERRGSFLVYLRVIVDNLIRDRWRSEARRPKQTELPEDISDHAKSPLEEIVAGDERERYEQALESLKSEQREAIILRFELDCSYEEIAAELGIASANAARMRVERGLVRLGQILEGNRTRP